MRVGSQPRFPLAPARPAAVSSRLLTAVLVMGLLALAIVAVAVAAGGIQHAESELLAPFRWRPESPA